MSRCLEISTGHLYSLPTKWTSGEGPIRNMPSAIVTRPSGFASSEGDIGRVRSRTSPSARASRTMTFHFDATFSCDHHRRHTTAAGLKRLSTAATKSSKHADNHHQRDKTAKDSKFKQQTGNCDHGIDGGRTANVSRGAWHSVYGSRTGIPSMIFLSSSKN